MRFHGLISLFDGTVKYIDTNTLVTHLRTRIDFTVEFMSAIR